MAWLAWIVAGYLSGSIPFAYLIGKWHRIDIRRHGSGNVGATNVTRILGRWWGVLCFLLDLTKGLAPVMLSAQTMDLPQAATLPPQLAWYWLAVAGATVTGHVFPVWLRFRGGKGVATVLGAMGGFWPIGTLPVVAAAVTWLLVASTFRHVSLASIAAALVIPVGVWIGSLVVAEPGSFAPFQAVTGLLGLLVIVRHRRNIGRLCAGTEPRLGQ